MRTAQLGANADRRARRKLDPSRGLTPAPPHVTPCRRAPYRVFQPRGSGGVGTVYRAHDTRSGDEVALKLLSTGGALNPLAARRLAREFETLYALNHPNIVRVFDAGVFQGYPYLTMELIEGLDLRRYLTIDSEPTSLAPAGVGSHSLSESL